MKKRIFSQEPQTFIFFWSQNHPKYWIQLISLTPNLILIVFQSKFHSTMISSPYLLYVGTYYSDYTKNTKCWCMLAVQCMQHDTNDTLFCINFHFCTMCIDSKKLSRLRDLVNPCKTKSFLKISTNMKEVTANQIFWEILMSVPCLTWW